MSSARLSAFAALNNSDSEDEIITYTNDDNTEPQNGNPSPVVPQTIQIDLGTMSSVTNTPPPFGMQPQSRSNSYYNTSNVTLITSSKFKPDDDNLIFGKEYVIIGLKVGESVMIKGQYKLIVQRGAVQIDSITYHSDPYHEITINAASLAPLPLINATQVTDSTITDDSKNDENEHLFTPDYKSVIKVSNVFNGLETFGSLYPQLKNIYPNWQEELEPNSAKAYSPLEEFDAAFFGYSFKLVVSKDERNIGTSIPKAWKNEIDSLCDEFKNYTKTAKQFKVLVIGPKNSGKSTFLRLLQNRLTTTSNETFTCLNILDIDPGQPEYSYPGCISLTKHEQPSFGVSLAFVNEQSSKMIKNSFIGFNTPQRTPSTYLSEIKKLIELNGDSHVLVNSPGWIKGFGIEILRQLTASLKPTHLIYLTSSSGLDRDESEGELLSQLSYDKLVKLQACFVGDDVVRYPASQIRNFKMLSYLHYSPASNSFNFDPLIMKSPYRISYASGDRANTIDTLIQSNGVAGVCLLDSNNINHEDLVECLEAQIVGLFAVPLEEFQVSFGRLIDDGKLSSFTGLPNLINSDKLLETIDMEFLGLSLIHSIDKEASLTNLYTPIQQSTLKDKFGNGDYKLVLVKGRSDVPIEEIIPRVLVQKKGGKKRKVSDIPYASFNSNLGKGGKALRVRRNIMRGGQ